MRRAGEIVDIEQRQRAAGDLLGAAERIAVERREQRRRVERGRQPDRDRHAAGSRHEVGEQVVRQRDALAARHGLHRAAGEDLRRRLHRQRIVAFERKAARPAHAHGDIADADGGRRQRQRHGAALLGVEPQRLRRGIAGHVDAVALHLDAVVAGLPFDIVDVEMHGAAIAVEQEARQRRGDHHLIADGDVGLRAADLVARPRHRHHAGGAGEVRDVEHDLGGAVGLDRDHARIERERLLRRRAALQLRRRDVAAAPDLAARALHAVDELAVEIAELGSKAPLAEIVVVRRRRLVVGEIEDADVDGGDDDARLLAGGKPADLDRNAQGAAGPRELRRLHVHRERARLAVDAEPLHADGAAGHALRAGVERTPQGRDHIGAGAPVLADRNLQPRGARLHVLRDGRQQPLADHAERDLAGGARGDRDRHVVAGRVFRLVERDLEHVGRIGGRFGVPAGVEADRRHRAVALAGRNLEPVAAPLHRQRQPRRRAGGRH